MSEGNNSTEAHNKVMSTFHLMILCTPHSTGGGELDNSEYIE